MPMLGYVGFNQWNGAPPLFFLLPLSLCFSSFVIPICTFIPLLDVDTLDSWCVKATVNDWIYMKMNKTLLLQAFFPLLLLYMWNESWWRTLGTTSKCFSAHFASSLDGLNPPPPFFPRPCRILSRLFNYIKSVWTQNSLTSGPVS